MIHAAETCPTCNRGNGDYWLFPASWLWIPELPKMTPDELVDYLAARRLVEKMQTPLAGGLLKEYPPSR